MMTQKFRAFLPGGRDVLWALIGAIMLAGMSGCASNGTVSGADRGGLYLAVGLETAIGTLISLEQTGTLPVEGADFIDATLAYGGTACKVLSDPMMTPDEKRLALLEELVAPRAEFDQAFAALVGSGLDRSTLLLVVPAINGARAAVRIALTEEVDPARYERPCATVTALALSWEVQRPVPVALLGDGGSAG